VSFRRHCYDKPHRCPGWAGGGWSHPREGKSICPSGSLSAQIWRDDNRFRWWKSYQCELCGTRTIPRVTRWLDPTWLWWYVRRHVMYDWRDSYGHYRSKVGCARLYAVYRASFYELVKREPRKWGG